MGPTLCFRGLDNLSYYSLTGPADAPRRYYMNYTGCGNSLNFDSPAVIRLVMDSLRYWVEVMHVDGFRFDLASVLGRGEQDGIFQSSASFFDAVSQDPVLNRAILIAEPWDLGTYQVGNFPGRLVRMERTIPRHDATLRQGRRRPAGRRGLAADRIGRPVRRGRPLRLQQRQLHHLPRRLHACTIWSRTTRSTTSRTARTIRTAPTTTTRGTAAWKARPTIRPSWRCASS